MIFPKIRVLRSHGQQAIEDLDAVELTARFRGRPELTEAATAEERTAVEQAAAICPTGALQDRTGIFDPDLPRTERLIPCQAECPKQISIAHIARLNREFLSAKFED